MRSPNLKLCKTELQVIYIDMIDLCPSLGINGLLCGRHLDRLCSGGNHCNHTFLRVVLLRYLALVLQLFRGDAKSKLEQNWTESSCFSIWSNRFGMVVLYGPSTLFLFLMPSRSIPSQEVFSHARVAQVITN